MEKTKVLLAEDDINLGKILKNYLEAKKFDVELFEDGEQALEAYNKKAFDFILLDIMMPIKDGFTVAKEIRKMDQKTPILFLTAKSMEEDKLKGFNIGADDYITKPFSMDVLLARINAIIKRTGISKDVDTSNLKLGEYVFDYQHQKLKHKKENKEQKLTSKESELLKLLYDHQNEVLDRKIALNRIWNDDSYFNARSMDVYITKLRKYLNLDEKIQILNVHGIGFKLLTK